MLVSSRERAGKRGRREDNPSGQSASAPRRQDMIRVAGLDIGLSLERKTSGLAIIVGPNISLDRRVGGANAYQPLLAAGSFQVIAIDGPIVPDEGEAVFKRAVERLFASGRFQRRCKPGFSHVKGTGLELRRAAGSAADCLAAVTSAWPPFLGVQSSSIVEAFPNAFLGVCLDDRCYEAMHALKRGRNSTGCKISGCSRSLSRGCPCPVTRNTFRCGLRAPLTTRSVLRSSVH